VFGVTISDIDPYVTPISVLKTLFGTIKYPHPEYSSELSIPFVVLVVSVVGNLVNEKANEYVLPERVIGVEVPFQAKQTPQASNLFAVKLFSRDIPNLFTDTFVKLYTVSSVYNKDGLVYISSNINSFGKPSLASDSLNDTK